MSGFGNTSDVANLQKWERQFYTSRLKEVKSEVLYYMKYDEDTAIRGGYLYALQKEVEFCKIEKGNAIVEGHEWRVGCKLSKANKKTLKDRCALQLTKSTSENARHAVLLVWLLCVQQAIV